jgi:hypothetical protein
MYAVDGSRNLPERVLSHLGGTRTHVLSESVTRRSASFRPTAWER